MSDIDVQDCGRTRVIVLSAPHRANSLSVDMVEDIRTAVSDVATVGCTTLVIRSTASTFCSGFDLSGLDDTTDAELLERFVRVEQMLAAVRSAAALTIAWIEGAAVGAGADLAASCDYRMGTEHGSFRFPGTRFGLLLGSRHLARLVGSGVAQDLLLRNQVMTGRDALDAGLFTHLVPAQQLPQLTHFILGDVADLNADVLVALLRVIRAADRGPTSGMEQLVASASVPGLRERMLTTLEARPGGGKQDR